MAFLGDGCCRGVDASGRGYVWWKTADEALKNPEQIMAQVMNIGDWEDVCRMVNCVGNDALRRVIREAEIGMFNDRSWHFWHYRLGLAELGNVPALPARKVAGPILESKE